MLPVGTLRTYINQDDTLECETHADHVTETTEEMSSSEAAMEEGTQSMSQEKTCRPYSMYELYTVAKFMDRDADLRVFRRFGELQMFNILSIQQRLTALEGDLQRRISACPPLSCEDLVPVIQHTLKEYNDALAAQDTFRSNLKPEAHILNYIADWSKDHALALREELCIKKTPINIDYVKDIVSIAAEEKSAIHRFIDRHERLRNLFTEKSATGDRWPTMMIYPEASVRRAEAVLLHTGFCVLLLCPIVALLHVDSTALKLIVLALFLLAMSVLSVGFLSTPNKAGLALVAGYAAILVVFLSNNVGS